MALFFGHALPYMATNNDGNLYAELLPADQRVEAASGTQEIAGGCLDSRVVDLRSRVEEQLNANLLFNSSMAGATGSVLPTNWASGSVSGLTYTISSASTVQGFRSIEWTVSGTALSDGDIYLACEPMQSGSVVAQIPNEYVGSMYCAKVSGTIKAAMVLQTLTQNFVDGAVQETKTKDLAAVTGQTFVRIEPNSVKTDIDLENRVNLRLYQPIASGEVVDFTIRVAAPQVEAGFVASPFISTVSGAVSEVRGRPSILVVPQLTKSGVVYPQLPTVSGADFTFTRATTATRVNASGLIESVASGLLRLDYPIGGGCPAALIEPSAQNLVFQSQNITSGTVTSGSQWFDSASLQGTSTSVQNNVSGIIAPDGTQSASLVSMTRLNVTGSTGSSTYVSQIQNLAVSGTYTSTIYIRAKDSNQVGKQINVWQWNGSAIINMILVTLTNDWQRVETTKVSTLPSGNRELLGFGFRQNQGNDLSAEFYVWGAQGELGSVATTYIPTTTGSATRNADVCSVSGVSGYIGQTQGTIYWEGEIPSTVNSKGILLQIGSSTNRVYISRESVSTLLLQLGTQSSAGYNFLNYTASSNILKVAVAYASGNNAFYVNGVQVSTASATANPSSAFTEIFIQDVALPDTTQRLRAAAIYTTRLSNDQLANLTRLT